MYVMYHSKRCKDKSHSNDLEKIPLFPLTHPSHSMTLSTKT
jgi:hypothetical protein